MVHYSVRFHPIVMRLKAIRALSLAALLVCCVGPACRQSSPSPSVVLEQNLGLQQPLTSFRQVLTSSVDKLTLQPGQEIRVPVHIENPGTETWISAGRFPVTISYKWFKNGELLPIEGERT